MDTKQRSLNTNAQQRIPPLFQEIMRVDAERAKLGNVLRIDLELRKRELRRAAEKALAWNTNKGNEA